MKGKKMSPIVKTLFGAVIGAAIGYVLYRFVGCKTGTCPLTANPWTSMLIWGIIGAISASGR
jgi:hypothetical protein